MSSNNKAELVKKLLQDLTQDRERYRKLKALLEEQYQGMLTGKVEDLLLVNQQLDNNYEALEQSALNRKEALLALGIPASAAGMELLFSKLPAPAQERVRDIWQDLENLARTCHSRNERNGLLLSAQMDVLKPLLQEGELDFLYSDQAL
ncbi:MAG: flagellar export chaperone FlgN [Enterobacteriaceae bacterium]